MNMFEDLNIYGVQAERPFRNFGWDTDRYSRHVLEVVGRPARAGCARPEGSRTAFKTVFGPTANLSRWLEPARLRYWIFEEISQLGWGDPRLTEHLRVQPEFRPRVLLAVLSYAYALALYSSRDIAEACRLKQEFRSLCNSKPPFAQELGVFRRHNRCLIERVLTGVFCRALGFRRGWEGTTPLLKWQEALGACAMDRLDLARHLDHVD